MISEMWRTRIMEGKTYGELHVYRRVGFREGFEGVVQPIHRLVCFGVVFFRR